MTALREVYRGLLLLVCEITTASVVGDSKFRRSRPQCRRVVHQNVFIVFLAVET